MSAPVDIALGFEVRIHRALCEPIMLGGAPRDLAILIGTLAAAIGLGLQQWPIGLALWILAHSGSAFAARRDPDFVAVLLRHLKHQGYFAC